MKTKILITALVLALFSTASAYAQCGTFTPPATPTGCDYTYTGTGATGWQNALGIDTAPPPAFGSPLVIAGSVCILRDLNYDFASIKPGTFYVAPGVTYTGKVDLLKDIDIIIEGTATFTNVPNTGGTAFYIYDTGVVTWPGDFAVSSGDVVHNNGILNIGVINTAPTPNIIGNLQVSSTFHSYSESYTMVTGDASVSGDYNNCGLLEMNGDLSTQGSSNFNNACATYVKGDFHINGDYTNVGLMYFNGQLNLSGPTILYNEGILVFDDLVLSGDDIIGIADQSVLIVLNSATLDSGSTVIDHYFYNTSAPLGSGFDSVCGTCIDDIEVLIEANVPSTVEEILADCGANISISGPKYATIDFDGIDDYLDSSLDLSGYQQATVMTWLKLDPAFSNSGTVLNQGDFEIAISATRKASVKVNNVTVNLPGPNTLKFNEWTHIGLIYNRALPTNKLKVYFNGRLVATSSDAALTPGITSSTDLFTIGKKSASNTNYFKGDIDEVRVFNDALTEDQMSKIVYQEIEENTGSVSGLIIPKTIVDYYTYSTIPWANLRGYYPMTDIKTFETSDFSSYNNHATLHNIETILEQTAPMPFQTSGDGIWNITGKWLHGDVWNMSELTDFGYSIVKVSHDMTVNSNLKTLGLLVDSGKTITMNGDNEINNSWYFGLDGTIDLKNDSQLVQGRQSDLVTSANGKILRRQEGQSNLYRYNYWSAPVGIKQATSYVDNNAASNNPNNTPFTLSMLKDKFGNNVQFTNAYHEDGKISSYWLYSFQNGVTYYDWAALNTTTPLISGLGYTQKGGGSLSDYIFEGKPNNGTILLSATDTGGAGSVPSVSRTQYLVGNPYPSAIDAYQFIDDNDSVTTGTIYLWEQWAGNSHNLADYEGGYATLNLLGQTKAYQFIGIEGQSSGSQDGQKTPTRYLPVGQGFMVEVVGTGNIKFNNEQREFRTEASGQSLFFRTTNNNETASISEEEDIIQKIKLEFVTSNDLGRELILGFSNETTTDGYDYGYDAQATEVFANDLTMPLDTKPMVIQGFAGITPDKVVDLNFKANGNVTYSIKATEFINIEDAQEVYLLDNLTGNYHDLKSGLDYNFSSEAGEFNNRFDVVFKTENSLSNEAFEIDNTLVYFNNNQDLLFVKGLIAEAKSLKLYNTLGQEIYNNNSITNQQLENGINISKLSTGMYVVSIKTDNNQTIDKKIIIE